jgi:hypothetical protein
MIMSNVGVPREEDRLLPPLMCYIAVEPTLLSTIGRNGAVYFWHLLRKSGTGETEG